MGVRIVRTAKTIFQELKKDDKLNIIIDMFNLTDDDVLVSNNIDINKDYAILVIVEDEEVTGYRVNYRHHKIDNDEVRAKRLELLNNVKI